MISATKQAPDVPFKQDPEADETYTGTDVNDRRELVLSLSLSCTLRVLGLAMLIVLGGIAGLTKGFIVAWICIAFGIAATVVTVAAQALPRTKLRLTSHGFAYGTLARRYFFRWSDVAWFGVCRFATSDWVVFTFADHYSDDQKLRAVNQRFGGFDRFLPDLYGHGPAELVELLETWRQEFGVENGEAQEVTSTLPA